MTRGAQRRKVARSGATAFAQPVDDNGTDTNTVTRENTTTTNNPDGSSTTTHTVTTDSVSVPREPSTISADQAHDLRTQSKADYKARKKVADANYQLNKADCEQSTSGALYRACKADAKQQARKDKADARMIHEREKAGIDAGTR